MRSETEITEKIGELYEKRRKHCGVDSPKPPKYWRPKDYNEQMWDFYNAQIAALQWARRFGNFRI
jgi:hypothetical protein